MYFSQPGCIEAVLQAAKALPTAIDGDALAKDLDAAATQRDIRNAVGLLSAAPVRLRDLATIQGNAERLLKALINVPDDEIEWANIRPACVPLLHLFDESETPESRIPGTSAETAWDVGWQYGSPALEMIRSIRRLAAIAKATAERLEKKVATSLSAKHGKAGDTWFVHTALPAIYEKHFGRKPRWGKPRGRSGQPYGPFIDFACACLSNVGIDMKPAAIVQAIGRARRAKR